MLFSLTLIYARVAISESDQTAGQILVMLRTRILTTPALGLKVLMDNTQDFKYHPHTF